MSDGSRSSEVIRAPAAVLGALHRVLRVELGETESARALQKAGLESGAKFYGLFREWLSTGGAGNVEPETLNPEEFWRRLSDFFEQLGWGRIQHDRVHPAVLAITAIDWVEAREDGGGSPACPFTTGLLAELLRLVAGGDLSAMEVECSAEGGGYSRILLGAPEALGSLFSIMRDGAPFEDALEQLV